MQYSIRKQAMAFILILILGILPMSAAADYAYKTRSDYVDVYLRVYIGSGPTASWTGHYDLQVNTTLRINDHVFVNPCFSYGSSSKMLIFSASETANVYRGSLWNHCRMYTLHIRLKGTSGLKRFFSYLDRNISSISTSSLGHGSIVCTFKKSCVFSKYTRRRVNCYAAASYFLMLLGNSTAFNIYRKAYSGGPSYLPKPFVQHYASHLVRKK